MQYRQGQGRYQCRYARAGRKGKKISSKLSDSRLWQYLVPTLYPPSWFSKMYSWWTGTLCPSRYQMKYQSRTIVTLDSWSKGYAICNANAIKSLTVYRRNVVYFQGTSRLRYAKYMNPSIVDNIDTWVGDTFPSFFQHLPLRRGFLF